MSAPPERNTLHSSCIPRGDPVEGFLWKRCVELFIVLGESPSRTTFVLAGPDEHEDPCSQDA